MTRLSPQKNRNRAQCGFTLIEIMIVVLLISILMAIALPNFINARESSRAKACIANLAEINSAKLQCVIDNKLPNNGTATFSIDGVTHTTPGSSGTYQLVNQSGSSNYLRQSPVCPAGGVYAPGSITGTPTCTVSVNATDTNYQPGNKYYHGL